MDDFDAMLENQQGRCAACSSTTPGGNHNTFHVDHCHVTGQVRALLCNTCNVDLGVFENKRVMFEIYLNEFAQ